MTEQDIFDPTVIGVCNDEITTHKDKKDLFIDKWKNFYFVYKTAYKNGKRVLRKLFEVECSNELCLNIDNIVVDGVTHPIYDDEGAEKLLKNIQSSHAEQQRKAAEKYNKAQMKKMRAQNGQQNVRQ